MSADVIVCKRRDHTVWTTCPCPPCRADKLRMAKRQRVGRYHRTTAEQAWERVEDMLRRGWTTEAIATAAGINAGTVQHALTDYRLRGHKAAFGPSIARRIITAGEPTAGRVGTVGARRKLRALTRLGHGVAGMARAAGVSNMTISYVRSGQVQSTHPRIVAGIDRAYTALSMTPGGSVQARQYAEARRWAPPLAWDDIDDPLERPHGSPKVTTLGVDEIAVTEAMSGRPVRLTKAEKREVALRLSRLGLSAAEIADRMGTNREAAAKLVTRGKAAA